MISLNFKFSGEPVCALMEHKPIRLLTGWSMVRIRPGEPLSFLKWLKSREAEKEAFSSEVTISVSRILKINQACLKLF